MTHKGSILNNERAVREAAASASSIKEALENLGLRAAGGNYRAFKDSCARFGISVPQFDYTSQALLLGSSRSIPNDEVFIRNSKYSSRSGVKKRLVRDFGWEYRCMGSECPSPEPKWGGKSLTLQLEHINGVWNDNRLENLMLLCPNCHSQTTTYAGRSRKQIQVCSCGNPKGKSSKLCQKCAGSQPRKKRIDWPEITELKAMVHNLGYSGAGRELGVSDNAVRKHIKNHP